MSREARSQQPIQLWAGMECTINRVGDDYHDQLELAGHYGRVADLDRFAGLGIRALRFPVLWERVAPDGLARADWRWVDERLERLRELGILPIVGLVHHGSGPRHTSLVDPAFAPGLAEFARAVAERYPWVTHFTPVNEPLTTARFSALYGHWYPHGRDARSFATALLQQCRAVVLAMQAIRQVTPNAQLVQTEDVGKTYSTPTLTYQAEFENERRWVSFDLLCGALRPGQPMWEHFRYVGVPTEDLAWFVEHPCPPDVLGINHYLSGERFLDERLEYYPSDTHGGNGRHRYADVLALRVLTGGVAGPQGVLHEAWQRYRLPLAVTEAHNGCTREEQLRWLWDVWQAAQAAQAAGVDVRAVTVWSLLGVYDWDQLVTRFEGHYEPGVFDLRAAQPRPTALAGLMRELAAGRRPTHPVLAEPGWWRRPDRLQYPPVHLPGGAAAPFSGQADADPTLPRVAVGQRTVAFPGTLVGAGPGSRGAPGPAPLLIAGSGSLAQGVARLCRLRGLSYRWLSALELPGADPVAADALLRELRPWAVVDTRGEEPTDVYECAEACAGDQIGAAVLAAACGRYGVRLLRFSSDQVFAGTQRRPYVESDPVAPLSAYGRSAATAEARVLQILPEALVARSGPLYGPWEGSTPVSRALRTVAEGNTVRIEHTITVSPTYLPDLIHAALDLLIDGEGGVWHLANGGAVSWLAFLQHAVETVGLDPRHIKGPTTPCDSRSTEQSRRRVLTSERGNVLPAMSNALARYAQQTAPQWREVVAAGHANRAAARQAIPAETPGRLVSV